MNDTFYEIVRYKSAQDRPEDGGHFRLNELAREIGQIADTISLNESDYDVAETVIDFTKTKESNQCFFIGRFSWNQFREYPFTSLKIIRLCEMEWLRYILEECNDSEKGQTMFALFETMDQLHEKRNCEYDARSKVFLVYWCTVLLNVFEKLISTKPNWDTDTFNKLFLKILSINGIENSYLFNNYLLPMINTAALKGVIDDCVCSKIDAIANEILKKNSVYSHKLADRLFTLIGKKRFPLDLYDAWANAALADISEMNEVDAKIWKQILLHALNANGTKPSKSWLEIASKLLETAGNEKFKGYVKGWFELTKVPTIHKPTEENLKLLDYLQRTPAPDFEQTFKEIFNRNSNLYLPFNYKEMPPEEIKQQTIKNLNIRDITVRFTAENSSILKGLVWFCSLIVDEEIIKSLRELAIQCYTTIPAVGPLAAGAGNACIYALTEAANTSSLAALQKLEHKIKNANLQKVIRKAYEAVSVKLGVSKEELEELGMEEFGFGNNDFCEKKIEQHTAAIFITHEGKTKIMWRNDKNKLAKSMPLELKSFEYEQFVKDVKRSAKDISQAFTIGKMRLEKMLMSQRQIEMMKWKKYYLNQELLRYPAKTLIWECIENQKVISFIWQNGALVDENGKPIKTNEKSKIRLWHPLSNSIELIKKWQDFIEQNKITQPFKQAFREIYFPVTDERRSDVSARFSGYTLKQAQFSRLCKDRGWRFAQHLIYNDSDSPYLTPTLEIENLKIKVMFEVEPDEESDKTESVGFFTYLTSGNIIFKNFEGEKINIQNIPPVIFSEVMRDIDLFISIAGTIKK
jgi:hypothetical protein